MWEYSVISRIARGRGLCQFNQNKGEGSGVGWEWLVLQCESTEGSVGQSPWKQAGSCPRKGLK